MDTRDFLFELGTEELPPKALKNLSASLQQSFEQGLQTLFGDQAATHLSDTQIVSYASPRRLALRADNLPTHTPAKTVEVTGPPVKISFDADNNPTKALAGFANKCGVAVSELTESNGKMAFIHKEPEQAIDAHLVTLIKQALDQLPIPKRMRWGASKVEFVRPAHWALMLLGDRVIDAEILGQRTSNQTFGHRFHHNEAISLNSAADYETELETTGFVIADFAKRRAKIRAQVETVAAEIEATAVIDEALLDEVTGLVEWPVALAGRFEERFLEVPPEALISSMKEHQKYFHVVDDKGAIQPYFITVSNIESRDPAQVIAGNEKVIRPRLSDAAFFFETDKKRTLEARIDLLKPIIFQAQLGSLYDKSERVAKLARAIAERMGSDAALAERAGQLSKTDLVTEMVLEFDDLQGLMGYYYALNDGENAELAQALNEQYQPKFAGDELPATRTGCALAIADRLDTLTGLFGINQPPSGSKDPFALRRATLGILRILVEKELDLDLAELLQISTDLHTNLPAKDGLTDRVLDFMLERFRAWYEEADIPVEVFLAVVATRPTKPLDFAKRVDAVNRFRTLPEAEALAAANKRVSNLLSKAGDLTLKDVDSRLLQESAEQALYAQINQVQQQVEPLFAKGDYIPAFEALATLRSPVDTFFDDVMVMAEDENIRNNRLALLAQLRGLFLYGADISLL